MTAWVLRQSWLDLLFAHWPVSPDALARLLPERVTVDLFEGQAWLGVIPFRLRDLGPRGLPGVPGATDFLELNVRTYVRVDESPGIWFFSLDAASSLAVAAARTVFGLPYFRADMSFDRDGEWCVYRSRRRRGDAAFEGRYRPSGPAAPAAPGSLDAFLVERYRLFTTRGGIPFKVEVEHQPWPLRTAEAEIQLETMAAAAGVPLPDRPPLLHFVDRLDVRTGPPLPVTRG
jgi:uncharacterized protein